MRLHCSVLEESNSEKFAMNMPWKTLLIAAGGGQLILILVSLMIPRVLHSV